MRFSLLSFVSLFVLALPVFVMAQNATSTATTSPEATNVLEAIIETVTGTVSTPTEPAHQSVLSTATEKRLTNLAANISNRLDGLNARLRHIAGRLDTRIQTQAQAGFEVAAAQTSLARAYESLDTASAELSDIDWRVIRTFRSLTPQAGWKDIRASYVTARDSIKEAHSELQNTVKILKAATPAVTIATSTATTTE